MKALEKRLAALSAFLPLEESNVESFLQEVAEVTSGGDRRTVGPVLMLADDNCPLSGVMSRMLSLLEGVPLAAYLDELMGVLPEFAAVSPRCAENEVKKLLWSDADRSELIAAVVRARSEQNSALRGVLEGIDVEGLSVSAKEVLAAIDCARSA